ncbi:MAG: PqqD family protein [Rhodobacteraceae bacterium]|nr:PqqD family protein [Paracoccaceae bacterium]
MISGWPFDARAPGDSAAPFFSIRAAEAEGQYSCECHVEARPVRRFDGVNALCDAISALAIALPAEDDRLICLHAAAVGMAGRLVVFPNVRRAGKSTLAAALAGRGHPLFSDDVLPLLFAGDGTAWGLAMGIAPRLRLPLPETLDPAFRDWAAAVGGPRNRQYQYLRLKDQPPHGEIGPVGAFVILDRRDGRVPAVLTPVAPEAAMDALLHQNFPRDRHSGDVLQAMAGLLAGRSVFRLTYGDLRGAVACLERAFAGWPGERPARRVLPDRHFRLADFGAATPGRIGRGVPVRQRDDTTEAEIGGTLYLADGAGRAIHRMDGLAALIWGLLAEPTIPEAIAADLAEAFPDMSAARIEADLRRLVDGLAEKGLVEAAD